jgi:cation transport regulator
MHNKKYGELPDSIQEHLPDHAQDINRETFNSVYETYADPK